MSEYINLQNYVWRQLTGDDAQLPHAMLFVGKEGVGKRELAEVLAARLLCENHPAPHAPGCGSCASCQMWAAGTHPDYRLVQPEAESEGEEGEVESSPGEKKKASKQIRIQQIREIEEFFYIGSHRGGARVCLIDPAESMNAVTANSLLKILEEPTASFYFIMISHRWHGLLPTLISRSRQVMFSPPAEAEANAWLDQNQLGSAKPWLPFYGHAPLALAQAHQRGQLKALESLLADLLVPQDPLAQAAKWEAHVKADGAMSMEVLVTTVQKWLLDLGLVAQGAAPRYFPHKNKALESLARKLSIPLLMEAHKQVAQIRRLANHPLNARLFLEDLCVRAFRPLKNS
ncbi:DNA polymerase III subunit delta' [Rhodocyclaceae bacterium]